jgi:GTP cyclohydrolase II
VRSSARLAPVDIVARAPLPTRWGTMQMLVFRHASTVDHVAMIMGNLQEEGPNGVLVRLHTECRTSEVFGSVACDCKAGLDESLGAIAKEGRGIVIYLRADPLVSQVATASAILSLLGVASIRTRTSFRTQENVPCNRSA